MHINYIYKYCKRSLHWYVYDVECQYMTCTTRTTPFKTDESTPRRYFFITFENIITVGAFIGGGVISRVPPVISTMNGERESRSWGV